MGQQLKDLSGQMFGKLTVLYRSDSDYEYYSTLRSSKRVRRVQVQWMVRCECGVEYLTTSSRLKFCRQSQCKSCKNVASRLNGRLSARSVARIKHGAKERGITFDSSLTKEWLYGLFVSQQGRCALTGLPIHFSDTSDNANRGGDSASLDRIDSSKGYRQDNVQWVDKRVNLMKRDLPEDEFVAVCRAVVNHASVDESKFVFT